jgi:poly(A) polymerase
VAAPTTIPRAEHNLSRRLVDDDALRVITRLQKNDFETYLVGGGVRDLLLERRPKDFDIGTSAHPPQIKRLFRNCWIIGRRFRLAHIKFGEKTLEVATFRRKVPPETDDEKTARQAERDRLKKPDGSGPIRRYIPRDNTFGTAEEDASRRDFTINALFYDVATRSILDYVDGMRDIRSRRIRCIGDPNERFVEDPVRMLRAVVLAARLDLTIDSAILTAIRRHRGEIVHSSPARLLEELYKIGRSGSAERIVHDLGEIGLLKFIAPELDRARSDALSLSLASLDRYRARFEDIPSTLRNSLLLGTFVTPFASIDRPRRRVPRDPSTTRPPEVALGLLPIARRDLEHLRQVLDLQRRLTDDQLPQRTRRTLTRRAAFNDALTWMEIHGQTPELIESWRAEAISAAEEPPRRRRRRRRRKRSRAGRPDSGGDQGPSTE